MAKTGRKKGRVKAHLKKKSKQIRVAGKKKGQKVKAHLKKKGRQVKVAGKKEITKRKKQLASAFTLMGMVSGVISIMFSLRKDFQLALVFLLLAVVFDFFDGKMARIMKSASPFGRELDSLADIISFGVAPVVFGMMQIRTTWAIAAFTFFLICGVIRLAKFNVQQVKGVYLGMPITMNGIILPIVYILQIPVADYPYLYFGLAIAMVAPFKIRKVL